MGFACAFVFVAEIDTLLTFLLFCIQVMARQISSKESWLVVGKAAQRWHLHHRSSLDSLVCLVICKTKAHPA